MPFGSNGRKRVFHQSERSRESPTPTVGQIPTAALIE